MFLGPKARKPGKNAGTKILDFRRNHSPFLLFVYSESYFHPAFKPRTKAPQLPKKIPF
jgi:hypothetical protein